MQTGANCVLLVLLLPGVLTAQSLPSGPVSALDGRLALGGEVVATAGESDEVAFFNYTDYEHNVLRMFRVALSAAWRPTARLAFVGEVRSEDMELVRPYAAYVRVRPWSGTALDIQAGRIPPAFGSFGRRAYYTDNPLIGYPLAYQYLTSLRPDAVPSTAADLLAMRGRGWRTTYPVGSIEAAPGVPLVSAFRWDTGVLAHWQTRAIELTGSVTSGTLSDPRVADNNDGRQISGRLAAHPVIGLVAGASASRGDWLSRSVSNLLPSDRSHAQTAFGADLEYSRDYWLVRGELVWSRWNVPLAATGEPVDLDARALWIEGRYRLTPRIVVGARLDRLDFSRIAAAPGAVLVTWDAPVRRVEAAAGYYVQRNLLARLAVQYNERDGGRVDERTFVSGQVAYWF